MDEFSTLAAMFGDRFDRLEGKLDDYLAAQADLKTEVALVKERQSTLSVQFKTVLGAIGTGLIALVGVVIQFWK